MGNTTALDILEETRELFANTHWTTGSLYTIDAKGKKRFCMVGGLCHVFAKHELPEWLREPVEANCDRGRQTAYVADFIYDNNFKEDSTDLSAILEAERQLAKTIDPELPDNVPYTTVETKIVNWNDGPAAAEFKKRGNASYVIETMDKTIKRVKKQQAPWWKKPFVRA